MASLMPHGKQQYVDNSGNLLSGGRLYTYEAGSSTPLATYSDQAGTTPNTNPIILNARGEATIFWGSAPYKVVLKTSTDAEIWTQDNLHASADLADLVSAEAGKGASLIGIEDSAGRFTGTNVEAALTEVKTAAELAASGGAALFGFLQSGTGAVSRTVQAKLRDRVSVKDFGAVGDGVADDTTKIQAAITAAGINGVIDVPKGTYLVSATLNALYGQWLRGAAGAWQGTVIKRAADYGDTLVFGDSSASGYCGPARVSDIFFQHGTMYNTGDASLDNKATTGAHIRMYGAQGPQIENVWAWRLPYQVVFEGGSVIKVENCSFKGIWDHATAALQEGVAQVYLKKSTNHGYPVTVTVNGCEFNGANVNARSVGFTTGDGTTSKSITELIGSTFGVLVDATEDISLTNNYLGGFNLNAVKFNVVAGGGVIDVRIADNHFDGARDFQINFDSTSAALYALGVQIHGNTFNGEVVSKGAIIAQNSGGAGASLVNFTIADNTFFQNFGSTITLFAANGGTIAGNTMESWNTLDIAQTDSQWVAGVFASNAYTKNILISGNVMGGGGNAFDQSTANTYTYKGVVIDASCVNVAERNNTYAGIRSGANFRTGVAQSPNIVIPTAEANYQMVSEDDAWIRKFAATAATAVILPQYPMKGREVVIKDGQGDATTWLIVVSTGDGTTIDGAASINIATNYGYKRFLFNGTQWNVIG